MAGPPETYQRLEPAKVAATVAGLGARIERTFPTRNLKDVAADLGVVLDAVARQSETNAPRARVVRIASRVAIALLVGLILVAIVSAIRAGVGVDGVRGFDWLSIIESGVNDVVFAGIAIYFLQSLPNRWHRRAVLASLHRLRSVAHIVDMHQMSKDPSALLPDRPSRKSRGQDDGSTLTRSEYAQYLDYCSELLSLVGKTAALCAEQSTDPVVLDTVSEIEALTTGMSRKIWQKISLLHARGER